MSIRQGARHEQQSPLLDSARRIRAGLNSGISKGNLPLAHRVADRAEAFCARLPHALSQTLGHGEGSVRPSGIRVDDQFLARQQAEADQVLAEHQADLAQAMALRQADMGRIQQKLDRMHIVLDRVQVQKFRKLEGMRFKLADVSSRRIVVLPANRHRVTVDAEPDIADMDVDINKPSDSAELQPAACDSPAHKCRVAH